MYVIAGVTGNTGSVAAQTLLDQGKAVKVIVRSEEKGHEWKNRGAEVAVLDLFDTDALTQTLRGAEGAYLLLPPDLGNEHFLQSREELAKGLVKAIESSNLPHVVVLSSIGAQHNEKTGPIRTVAKLERLLEASKIKYTAVRPAYFLENWGAVLPAVIQDGVLPSFLHPLDRPINMVATKDIGKTIADALLHPGTAQHNIIELTGREPYSPQQVANAFSHALGKTVNPVAVPQEAWVESLTQVGLPKTIAELFSEMYESINNGNIHFVSNDVKQGDSDLQSFINTLVAQ